MAGFVPAISFLMPRSIVKQPSLIPLSLREGPKGRARNPDADSTSVSGFRVRVFSAPRNDGEALAPPSPFGLRRGRQRSARPFFIRPGRGLPVRAPQSEREVERRETRRLARPPGRRRTARNACEAFPFPLRSGKDASRRSTCGDFCPRGRASAAGRKTSLKSPRSQRLSPPRIPPRPAIEGRPP
jgi:hypothetical protein